MARTRGGRERPTTSVRRGDKRDEAVEAGGFPGGIVWTPYHFHRVARPFESISFFRGYIRYGSTSEKYMSDRVLRQFGYKQKIPDVVMPYNRVFLRPLIIDGYILLIIWLAVLPQPPSHMHAQTTTWIDLCVSPIHLLVLVLRMRHRMCHPIVDLVVQLTETLLLRQIRKRVQ